MAVGGLLYASVVIYITLVVFRAHVSNREQLKQFWKYGIGKSFYPRQELWGVIYHLCPNGGLVKLEIHL